MTHSFAEKLSKINAEKKNSVIDRSWSSAKLPIIQNYADSSNEMCL